MLKGPRPIAVEEYASLWYQALGEEHGLLIPFASPDDRVVLLNSLYRARKDLNDPRLDALAVHQPAAELELWIHHKPSETLE